MFSPPGTGHGAGREVGCSESPALPTQSGRRVGCAAVGGQRGTPRAPSQTGRQVWRATLLGSRGEDTCKAGDTPRPAREMSLEEMAGPAPTRRPPCHLAACRPSGKACRAVGGAPRARVPPCPPRVAQAAVVTAGPQAERPQL